MSIKLQNKPIEITIQVSENGGVLERKAKAYLTAVPGLAVQHDSGYGGRWLDTWAVTHQDSGYRVLGSFKTLRAARQFAARISRLTDWTENRETIMAKYDADPEFKHQLSKLKEKFRAERAV